MDPPETPTRDNLSGTPKPTPAPPAPEANPVDSSEDVVKDLRILDSPTTPIQIPVGDIHLWDGPPEPMGPRTGPPRDVVIEVHDVDPATTWAILRGLRWLKEHQEESGYWHRANNSEGDAMTGLALLAFLAHGDTPATGTEFSLTVQKAIDYLVQRVEAKPDQRLGRAYTHGIVAYALAEAHAMTGIPEVQTAAENALRTVLAGQQPGGGYNYRYGQGDRWDLSVSSWQFQTMKAATLARLDVPGLAEGTQRAVDWLETVNVRDGRFGYSAAGRGGPAMQGAGALSLQMFGRGRTGAVRGVVEQLASAEPRWAKTGHIASYTWYYILQALYHEGGRGFDRYYADFCDMLVEHQAEDGHWDSPSGETRGYRATLNTALNCLSLQVIFRYLPTYKSPTHTADARDGGGEDWEFSDEDLDIQVLQ